MSQRAVMSLKECLSEAQKRGDTLCNCFHSGYKLHSLRYQQINENINPNLEEIKLLNNTLKNTCFNLHPRVQQRLYPQPQSLLLLTREIYSKKWKFIDNCANNLFPSKLVIPNITKFMSNNNCIKDPRLLFNTNNKDDKKSDDELRNLTNKYCERMLCCAHYIHPKLEKELKSLNINTIINHFNINSLHFESWMKSISYYQDNNYLMCLLFTTSFIERLLGDLLLVNNEKQKQKDIPHNIIDLLMLDNIKQQTINNNNDLHLLLFCLMGPPFSCNIRNLAWHGFFNNQHMIPKHFCSFLLYIIQELIFIINKSKNKTNGREYNTILLDQFSQWSQMDKIPTLQKVAGNDMVKLMDGILKESYFIPICHQKDFMQIFKLLYLSNDIEMDYYQIGCLLFCILENCIRQIIVSVSNNKNISLLPTTRILAQDDILFVSFIYLNHRDLFRMKIPFQLSHQQITTWISNGFMFLLQDLIIANAGPRFRDNLAHFEVDTKHISPILIHLLMNLCIYSILRFSWYDVTKPNAENNVNNDGYNAICDIYQFVDNYKPCYHPLSFCITEWKQFQIICQDFQMYAAKHFSTDVNSVQCGNSTVNISHVLQKTIRMVNKLKSFQNQSKINLNKNVKDTPLHFLEFMADSKRYNLNHKAESKEMEKPQNTDDNIFENMNQSIANNITKMLRIMNPCIQSVMDTHEIMDKEINCIDNEDKQIPTRKLKQFCKLTHSLSIWACCLDLLFESIQCAFCNEIKIPYKLWSKYLQCATKMQNKLRSNQFGQGLLELKQCMQHCQNWIDKQS